jgi:glycyl-tRNA synthetase
MSKTPTDNTLQAIISHAKEYGFVFPSSEIYDGLGAVYDYGPYGAQLKKNIRDYWWNSMTQMNENIVGIDAAIFMHPTTWKASGHVDSFSDPLIDNKDSKKRYRADVLLEEHIEKIRQKIEKEVEKGRNRFGDSFDEDQVRATNPNVIRNIEKITSIEDAMNEYAINNTFITLLNNPNPIINNSNTQDTITPDSDEVYTAYIFSEKYRFYQQCKT